MCELGVEHTSTWLMVDPWEAGQSEYKRTAVVLEHFDEMLNQDVGGLMMSDGRKRKYKVMLLAGGDLIESFGEPGVWSEPDVSQDSLFAPKRLAEQRLSRSFTSSSDASGVSLSSGLARMSGRSYYHMTSSTTIGQSVLPSQLAVPDMRIRRNVIVIKQLIYNDISSTKVRLFVRRGMSIK